MEKLGIELPLLITQFINFTIMVVVLTKLLYKPILKVLKDRQKKIEEGLAFSEQAKTDQERSQEKKKEVLLQAHSEAKKIIDQARVEGRKVKEDLLKEGKTEIDEMRHKLEDELTTHKEEITAQISSHTVDVAAEMVKSILPGLLGDKDQHKLIQKQLLLIEKKTHGTKS